MIKNNEINNYKFLFSSNEDIIIINHMLQQEPYDTVCFWGNELRLITSEDFLNSVFFIANYKGENIGFFKCRFNYEVGSCKVAWFFTKKTRTLGKSLRAILAFIRFAFVELNIKRIESSWLLYNKNGKFYEKIFPVEGILKKASLHRGELVDVMLFAIIKDEFEFWWNNKASKYFN